LEHTSGELKFSILHGF